jgi:hypothetical protein
VVDVPGFAGVDGLAAAAAAGTAEVDDRLECGSMVAVGAPVVAGAGGAADRQAGEASARQARAT